MSEQDQQLDVELGGLRADAPVPPSGHPLVAVSHHLADRDLYPADLATPLPVPTLVRAMILHALYALGPDLLAAEHLTYNRLFRWFLGEGWWPQAYVTSREQLLAQAGEDNPFGRAVLVLMAAGLWDQPPFRPDEALVEAWTGASLLAFEDLQNLDNRSMQRLLRDVDMAHLALALLDAPPALTEHVLRNLSSRVGAMLEEEMGYFVQPRPEDIREARAGLVGHARKLVRRGEIGMPSRGRPPGP